SMPSLYRRSSVQRSLWCARSPKILPSAAARALPRPACSLSLFPVPPTPGPQTRSQLSKRSTNFAASPCSSFAPLTPVPSTVHSASYKDSDSSIGAISKAAYFSASLPSIRPLSPARSRYHEFSIASLFEVPLNKNFLLGRPLLASIVLAAAAWLLLA